MTASSTRSRGYDSGMAAPQDPGLEHVSVTHSTSRLTTGSTCRGGSVVLDRRERMPVMHRVREPGTSSGDRFVTLGRRHEGAEQRFVPLVDVSVAADPRVEGRPTVAHQRSTGRALPSTREPAVRPGRRGCGRRPPCSRSTDRTKRGSTPVLGDAVDARLVIAGLTEDMQRGVEDSLLCALPAVTDSRVVGERRPAHHGFRLRIGDAVGRRNRRVSSFVRSVHATYSACALSLRAGTIGGAFRQFGMPESSLANREAIVVHPRPVGVVQLVQGEAAR